MRLLSPGELHALIPHILLQQFLYQKFSSSALIQNVHSSCHPLPLSYFTALVAIKQGIFISCSLPLPFVSSYNSVNRNPAASRLLQSMRKLYPLIVFLQQLHLLRIFQGIERE